MKAEKIKQLRLMMGLTQEAFARQTGFTISTIHRWETGKVKPSPIARKVLQDKAKEWYK